jgi:hypothetical protein
LIPGGTGIGKKNLIDTSLVLVLAILKIFDTSLVLILGSILILGWYMAGICLVYRLA